MEDCSIVCGIINCINYEMRFNVPILTGNIYPQIDKWPIVNPEGIYFVRIFFNGLWRKIEVVDQFPFDISDRDHPKFKCCYDTKHNQIWMSLVERALLKVRTFMDP